MLTYWVLLLPALLLILLLSVAGTRGSPHEPRSFNADTSLVQQTQVAEVDNPPNGNVIRHFACPAGFFRLRRNCYYLSAGTEGWREAHFQCVARNATLAVLNRNGKDNILRNYLMGEQFRRLERWIGGAYNWRRMTWEWGVSGEKMLYTNFADENSMSPSNNFAHHCTVLDPRQQYKWSPRSCVEQKYYVCEVPAGRIGKSRRRKNITDPMAPQNQRLRPPSRRNKHKHHYHSEALQEQRRRNGTSGNKLKSMRKKNWHHSEDDNQIWAHGIKFGSRPPKGSRRGSLKRPDGSSRHSGHKHMHRKNNDNDNNNNNNNKNNKDNDSNKHIVPETVAVSHVSQRPGDFGSFPANGHILTDERLQSLDDNNHYYPPFGKDYVREEVLLKV